MTLEAIRAVLIAHLADNWREGESLKTAVAWPNQPFEIPAGAAFIRPTVKPGQTFESERGEDALGLRTGSLVVGVFVPSGTGIAEACRLAGELETLYRRRTLSGVLTGEPSTTDVGDDGQGFYHLSVTVPFHAWTGA
jgi:hypothetical protein